MHFSDILMILGDDEKQVLKYTQDMEKMYDAARRMKLNQTRNERRAIVDEAPVERLD